MIDKDKFIKVKGYPTREPVNNYNNEIKTLRSQIKINCLNVIVNWMLSTLYFIIARLTYDNEKLLFIFYLIVAIFFLLLVFVWLKLLVKQFNELFFLLDIEKHMQL